jgi:hypothetical protein
VSYTATPVFGSATAETSGALVRRGPAGRLGRRGLGYLLLFQTLLPLLGPVVDVFVVYGLVFLQPARVIAVWLGFLLLQLTMGWYAFRLDGERTGPLWSLPLQQFVYRQLMCLVVVQSVFPALAARGCPGSGWNVTAVSRRRPPPPRSPTPGWPRPTPPTRRAHR